MRHVFRLLMLVVGTMIVDNFGDSLAGRITRTALCGDKAMVITIFRVATTGDVDLNWMCLPADNAHH